jgi:large subunit ribosomal protein L9
VKVDYVLKKALRKRGDVGDLIKVAKGYGRYLEGQDIAQRATREILKEIEEKKANWKNQSLELEKEAAKLIEKIEGMKIILKRKTSQNDKLYETIRPEHVVEGLLLKGIKIEKRNVYMRHQIKNLGTYKVLIHIYGSFEKDIELEVISDVDINI